MKDELEAEMRVTTTDSEFSAFGNQSHDDNLGERHLPLLLFTDIASAVPEAFLEECCRSIRKITYGVWIS